MSDLTRRTGSRLTRTQRQQRAYRLAMTSGGAAVAFVAAAVLAVLGVLPWGIAILALVIAAIAGLLFRRTVS